MAAKAYDQKILILDFGSQYTQLIARRIRAAKVYCEVHPFSMDIQKIRSFNPKGIVLSGELSGIHDADAPVCNPAIFNLDVPLLRWEVDHTDGLEIIKNFLFNTCGCEPVWTMTSFVAQTVLKIRKFVGDHKVLCALSGGVDSSVTAMLLHKAIGDRLVCVFVDHGLNRKNEPQKVEETFKKHYGMNFHKVNAAEIFLSRLAGIIDPEKKRKIIGNTFIDIFENKAKDFEGIEFLAQGTIYPDVIESISLKGQSSVIKSHHNVGGLPEKMNLKLVEPLRELFKDEVREVGLELGIPGEMVMRQPFPGPGLAVRVVGEVTEERLNILREADEIVRDEIAKAGLHEKVWQYFAVLLPVKTVGVTGDKRTYENVIAVRCVDSIDAMTADWSKIPYDVLAAISTKIIAHVSGVNRVVYDISSKPPSTIEWE